MDRMDRWESIKALVTESIIVDKFLCSLRNIDIKRVEAFNALSGERDYQESLHKKTGQDPISIPGELALLKVYLDKAFVIYANTFGDPGEQPTMDVIRKITAIGLRAMENYGCPSRDIEGSLAARPVGHRAEGDSNIYFKKKDVEKYLNLLRSAPEAITKLDIRFARAQQELLEDITTAPVEPPRPEGGIKECG